MTPWARTEIGTTLPFGDVPLRSARRPECFNYQGRFLLDT